ncbi:universal stress protein [Paractinoplanes durhamensis]|uniref:Universal stress protein n=1 Tax=Paractinoplanes durhamensis TaxID=113563 RepID=A0ABQ3YRH4_9ACTN|nr:universal stress protein [Actinoplanes durhamensis]GIE00177.1 universal stress protein [Actinoplanes durhamensis]
MNARKIVIGYDHSTGAADAAQWALDEAERTGAPVEFFYAYEWPTWSPAARYVPGGVTWPGGETELEVEGALEAAVARARRDHPALLITSHAADAVAAVALVERSSTAGLVVLGSRGHSAVVNLVGSVGVAVTAHAHCPVVVVRGQPPRDAPIVVGIDSSRAAEAALSFAVGRAAARGVALRVVQAWKPGGPAPAEKEHRLFEDRVAGLRAKHPGLTVSAEAPHEHPAAALAKASATAQLLVVGSRGRGALLGMMLGSVSQHLLRSSVCSVAVVHENMSAA